MRYSGVHQLAAGLPSTALGGGGYHNMLPFNLQRLFLMEVAILRNTKAQYIFWILSVRSQFTVTPQFKHSLEILKAILSSSFENPQQ